MSLSCQTCTFVNQLGSEQCEMCNTPLEKQKMDTTVLQSMIEANLHKSKIDKNMEEAYEIIPECFFSIDMLHILIEVNGQTIKALVDTGAQVTVISKKCAEDCGIDSLIDYRCAGTTYGVGERKILGKIWMTDVFLGKHALPCSFTVLDDVNFDIIFGLNMMLKYGCILDLNKKCLRIGDDEIQFV